MRPEIALQLYYPFFQDENCAVMGTVAQEDAARLTYFGLHAQQHRGQRSSGIGSSDGETISLHKGLGLVSQVYTEDDINNLRGNMTIGHNRYPTSSVEDKEHNQPVYCGDNTLLLAHNGNLPSKRLLQEFLDEKGVETSGLNDSELMHRTIRYHYKRGASIEEAIREAYPLFTGAFSLLVMTNDKLVALRDSFGIRPLSIGKLNGGYVVSSETCAMSTITAEYLRDVEPGEMVVFDQDGSYKSEQIVRGEEHLDVFEYIYFSRPNSILQDQSVYSVRYRLGEELARECPADADIVVPIMDTSLPIALGYAKESGLEPHEALSKNRYIHRTFIHHGARVPLVEMKHDPIYDVIEGKRVVVIDDSIVRGTTMPPVLEKIWRANPKEIHLRIASPEVRFPDLQGIDTATIEELIARKRSLEERRAMFAATSYAHISVEGLLKAVQRSRERLSLHAFDGRYFSVPDKVLEEIGLLVAA